LGSVAGVVIVSGVLAMSSVEVMAAVCGVPLESVTEIVTEYEPEKVVVPLIKPVEELPVMPRGSPDMVHVNGCLPPDVCGWKLYGTLGVPAGSAVVVMVRVVVPTVNGQVVADTTPSASFTWTVKVPAAVGVPVMAPVAELTVRPVGRVPTTEKV